MCSAEYHSIVYFMFLSRVSMPKHAESVILLWPIRPSVSLSVRYTLVLY